MRIHRETGGGPQRRRHVVPCGVQQALARALPAPEGGEKLPLALETMLAILGELRVRVGDPRPVAGTEEGEAALAQALER